MGKRYGIWSGNMNKKGTSGMTLESYRALEFELHSELMKTCRRYIHELGIISMLGILDVVKQEVIELEKVSRKIIRDEETQTEEEIKNK